MVLGFCEFSQQLPGFGPSSLSCLFLILGAEGNAGVRDEGRVFGLQMIKL